MTGVHLRRTFRHLSSPLFHSQRYYHKFPLLSSLFNKPSLNPKPYFSPKPLTFSYSTSSFTKSINTHQNYDQIDEPNKLNLVNDDDISSETDSGVDIDGPHKLNLVNNGFIDGVHSESDSGFNPLSGVDERRGSLGGGGGGGDAYAAIELALDSVVKIFTVTSSPNYTLPWQNKSQRETMGSGFVISGRRILTNAHVVADHSFVLVRKHGSSSKYKAEVQAVGHECDLAILLVENEEFWQGMNHLELGDVPFLQEAVAVVGYPQGGDNISVTKGVVSRVEPTQYVHGASQLLAIQIDAAINPGNSGGPAIMGDKVAGVAFQNLSGAENIGYIIPVPVIKHFVASVEERGKYVGFCSLGLSCQAMENSQLREHFGMKPGMTGVLVNKINPLSEAHKILKKDDVILAFDGVPIANDGTVPFRNRERITFDHLVSMKKPNEKAELKVLRDGKECNFPMNVFPLQPLVPVHLFDKLPSYYIFAGLVFIPLNQPYLHEYGEDWYNASPRKLCELALRELPKKQGEQLVILSQVLMDDINTGYERLSELQVKKVNGMEIDNLKHLCRIVEECKEERLRLDLDDDRVIVLDYHKAKLATSRILKRHRIPSSMSTDLVGSETRAEHTEPVLAPPS